jgi:hypothetical protein
MVGSTKNCSAPHTIRMIDRAHGQPAESRFVHGYTYLISSGSDRPSCGFLGTTYFFQITELLLFFGNYKDLLPWIFIKIKTNKHGESHPLPLLQLFHISTNTPTHNIITPKTTYGLKQPSTLYSQARAQSPDAQPANIERSSTKT